jgi:hypothetical protein
MLVIVIAADREPAPELYALTGLLAALEMVVVVLLVLCRLPGRVGLEGAYGCDEEEPPSPAGSDTLSPASAVLVGIVNAAIGILCLAPGTFGARRRRW